MKPIPGYEGVYSITKEGRVYSHRRVDARNRTKWGIFLKPKVTRLGYLVIGLRDGAKKRSHSIHRLVGAAYLGLVHGQVIDHIDGDKTNNRVENIRVCTASQNQGNRKRSKNNKSGFKGVCWVESAKTWKMSCRINGSRRQAHFKNKEEAARAYDAVAIEAHGEFARINFPA